MVAVITLYMVESKLTHPIYVIFADFELSYIQSKHMQCLFVIDQIISVTSNFKSANSIAFTATETINITVIVDLTTVTNDYFTQFRLGVYSNLNNLLYYWSINSKYWTQTVSITSGHQMDAGLYEISLFSSYSNEFSSHCKSYYDFIRGSPFSLSNLVYDKIFIHLSYYGKCLSMIYFSGLIKI